MRHIVKRSAAVVMMAALLLAGCSSAVPKQSPIAPSSAAQPAASEAVNSTASTEPLKSNEKEKNANWVIEIEDTQQVTDEAGVIWNYKLSMYASKADGTDVLGNYTGEMTLDMDPDIDSVKALAAKEGAELLSMLFRHQSIAKDVSFEVVKYSQETYNSLMKDNASDLQLRPVGLPDSPLDAVAVSKVTFEATQYPINMNVKDGDVAGSATVPGGKTTVTVPAEVEIEGATAYCYIYKTIHPLGRAFKGVVTGDVLN